MTDEDDGDATLLELADDGEQALHFRVGQCRGWFVHDEDLGVTDQGAADGDQLAIGDGEGLDVGLEVDGQPELVDDALRGLAHALARGDQALLGELAEHGDVLGRGKIGEQ